MADMTCGKTRTGSGRYDLEYQVWLVVALWLIVADMTTGMTMTGNTAETCGKTMTGGGRYDLW